jgi:hypothetical protein
MQNFEDRTFLEQLALSIAHHQEKAVKEKVISMLLITMQIINNIMFNIVKSIQYKTMIRLTLQYKTGPKLTL